MTRPAWRDWAGVTVAPVVMAALLGAVAARAPQPAPLVVLPAAACREPPVFTAAYEQDRSGLRPKGQGYVFEGVSVVSAVVCEPGTLVLGVQGQAADGRGPQLDIALDGVVLDTPVVTGGRTVRVRVPRPGRLSVAFLNDLYRADVRIVDLTGIAVTGTGPGCPTPAVTAQTSGVGAVWTVEPGSAGPGSATLTWAGPLVLKPCAAGTLRLRLRGRPARDVLPVVQIAAGGAALITETVSARWHDLRVAVPAAPVTIRVLNPLNTTVANRSATVKSMTFIPDAAPDPSLR